METTIVYRDYIGNRRLAKGFRIVEEVGVPRRCPHGTLSSSCPHVTNVTAAVTPHASCMTSPLKLSSSHLQRTHGTWPKVLFPKLGHVQCRAAITKAGDNNVLYCCRARKIREDYVCFLTRSEPEKV